MPLFPPFELVDTIDFFWIAPWRDKFFLRQKYVEERLSTEEIATQTFSAKSTILKYLKRHDIPLRETGVTIRRLNWIAYGRKMVERQEVPHQREMETLRRMTDLRDQGFTYEKIAQALNSLGVPTKTHKGKWHRKVV